jgi:hypothetical protein
MQPGDRRSVVCIHARKAHLIGAKFSSNGVLFTTSSIKPKFFGSVFTELPTGRGGVTWRCVWSDRLVHYPMVGSCCGTPIDDSSLEELARALCTRTELDSVDLANLREGFRKAVLETTVTQGFTREEQSDHGIDNEYKGFRTVRCPTCLVPIMEGHALCPGCDAWSFYGIVSGQPVFGRAEKVRTHGKEAMPEDLQYVPFMVRINDDIKRACYGGAP